MTAPMFVPTFYLQQKIAMTANRYRLVEANPDGSDGRLLGFAQQKRLAFKEQVTFYTDEDKQRPVFAFKARNVMELGAGYDVTDEAGAPLGYFKKDFGKSLLRSTFLLEGPGFTGSGQERSQGAALVRRFADIPFIPIHFDFVSAEGQPLFSVDRQARLRDHYSVHVADQRVDFRLAASVAVALDAAMQR